MMMHAERITLIVKLNLKLRYKGQPCVTIVMYISLLEELITAKAQEGNNLNNNDEKVVFKHCTPFTDCISEINKTQIDNANYDVTTLI